MDRLQTPSVVTSDFVYLRLIGDRRLSDDQFDKLLIDRTEEIRNWVNKMKEISKNEKDVKIGIVAANNHYGGYGSGTVDIFRQNMDLETLSFENADITEINRQLNRQLALETRFAFNRQQLRDKGKQTSMCEYIE